MKETNMMFSLDADARINGTSLAQRTQRITPDMMRTKFGECHNETFEDDKGYHDGEWNFTDTDGNGYSVYFRYNECNVGAHFHVKDRAYDLITYILLT